MTLLEYKAQQEMAKEKGLCKYIRENKSCINGPNCMFYHGRIEDTYGIQYCRSGRNCNHLKKGECKFRHEPTNEQLHYVSNLYKSLYPYKKGFLVDKNKCKKIDNECINNPFFILRRKNAIDNDVYYTIPGCSYVVKDTFGTTHPCGKNVFFMTLKKETNHPNNFYCCYDHMIHSEPDPIYIVKQNILNKIFDQLGSD
jgi:hypothetical protein